VLSQKRANTIKFTPYKY